MNNIAINHLSFALVKVRSSDKNNFKIHLPYHYTCTVDGGCYNCGNVIEHGQMQNLLLQCRFNLDVNIDSWLVFTV